jgi:hypothetical protein
MRPTIKMDEVVPVETPTILQKAINHIDQSITSNAYDSHHYRTMVLNCAHLTNYQQDEILTLFSKYASLFDGTLGKIPNIKVHFDQKPDAKPFCANAYKIPHHIIDIARQEVEELCCIGVLQKDVYSEWGAPCLFC